MSKMSENELRRRLDLLSSIEPSPQATCRALDRVRRTLDQAHAQPSARPASFWRTIITSRLTKPAIAAAVFLTIAILWQSATFTRNAYALSDVPHLLEQAKTIHMRMRLFHGAGEHPAEFWYDRANGRMYRSLELNAVEKGPNGLQNVTEVTRTICDGQYTMEVNDRTKTVGFQKLLASQQQLNQALIAEGGLKMALQDIRNLDKYTRIGKEEINGHPYDMWRREFRMAPPSQLGYRSDYWVSPTTGSVGRVREWFKGDRHWILMSEIDAIEIDVEPPAGLFSTEPPAGYTVKTGKDAAEVTGIGVPAYEGPEGYFLRAPISFALEDGSILVCWRMTGGPALTDPNDLYKNLSLGGDLAQTPMRVFGLVSAIDKERTEPVLHYAGRHVAVTRKTGRVYEWALYVPPHTIACTDRAVPTIAAIQPAVHVRVSDPRTPPRPLMRFTSWCITRNAFEQYVPAAARELSDDQAAPAELDYDALQALAQRVRSVPELYEAVRVWIELPGGRVAELEPVEITTPVPVGQQATELVEAFFAAVIEGRDAHAMKMLKYEEPRARRVVTGLRRLPGVREIKVEDVYATDETALVITSEFATYESRSRRWTIGAVKEKGIWLIKDFDATNAEGTHEEISKYLQRFPDAKHFSK